MENNFSRCKIKATNIIPYFYNIYYTCIFSFMEKKLMNHIIVYCSIIIINNAQEVYPGAAERGVKAFTTELILKAEWD